LQRTSLVVTNFASSQFAPTGVEEEHVYWASRGVRGVA
jgi:hypothetical protein